MNEFFDLPLGFVYIQIGIAGVVLTLIGCIVSLILWLSRGAILNALPSAYVVLAMPLMLLGIIPGAEFIAVPLAFLAALIACFLHFFKRSEAGTKKDSIVAIILLVGLLGIVIAFALGSLSGGGE